MHFVRLANAVLKDEESAAVCKMGHGKMPVYMVWTKKYAATSGNEIVWNDRVVARTDEALSNGAAENETTVAEVGVTFSQRVIDCTQVQVDGVMQVNTDLRLVLQRRQNQSVFSFLRQLSKWQLSSVIAHTTLL